MGEPSPLPPVALDAMGGDHAPDALIAGAVDAVRAGFPVMLVGDSAQLQIPHEPGLSVRHAPHAVAMDEQAARSVRRKPNSSLREALEAVKEGEACAAVSCGNTGAFMAAASIVLGRVRGVDRPAIATVIPRQDNHRIIILDLGANADCQPLNLVQFAAMGRALATAMGEPNPRVGLLSNGEEGGKGNALVRETHPLLKEAPFEYVGQIEPGPAFEGGCEVLVTDGFTGNIMLKSVEATAALVTSFAKEELDKHRSSRLAGRLLGGTFRRLRGKSDYASFGGGLLVGVQGVVVVGHGRSDARAVASAIRHAHQCAADRLPERVAEALQATVSSPE